MPRAVRASRGGRGQAIRGTAPSREDPHRSARSAGELVTTFIHVNRGTIASNAKHGTSKPAVRFQKGRYGKATYAHEVSIEGPSRVIYSPHEPLLPCGARLVIATESPVKVIR